jgi:hypothetical protein
MLIGLANREETSSSSFVVVSRHCTAFADLAAHCWIDSLGEDTVLVVFGKVVVRMFAFVLTVLTDVVV